jgi:hypothetical protein
MIYAILAGKRERIGGGESSSSSKGLSLIDSQVFKARSPTPKDKFVKKSFYYIRKAFRNGTKFH